MPRHDFGDGFWWVLQDMKRHGLVSEEQIQEAHKQSIIQMQHIQDAAKHPNVKAPASSGS